MANKTSRKRLMKELADLTSEKFEGIEFDPDRISANLKKWRINVVGAHGTFYEGEKFELNFTFTDRYPFDPPQVIFSGAVIPKHPHIYTNGHICLSILTEDWSPAMSVTSVCLSILSMLSSATVKESPPDNGSYVKRVGNSNPSKTAWWFHDDKA